MSITPNVESIPRLGSLGNVVPEGYAYYQKHITPRPAVALPNAYLKWYNLYPTGAGITAAQEAECRAFLFSEAEAGRLKLDDDLGFIVLHRAGSVLLLLLTTWRNTNEMWESIYVQDLSGAGSGWRPIVFENSHKGTYCVWELGVVWHERNAWVRFLSSARDEAAKLAYIRGSFEASV